MRKLLSLVAFAILPGACLSQYTFVSLKPAGSTQSFGQAISGSSQGGYWSNDGVPRAAFWQGTAGSFVDLNPGAGWDDSQVLGIGSGIQVGFGRLTATSEVHALLWNGSATETDVHPGGFANSQINGTSGVDHVGFAYDVLAEPTAILWQSGVPTNLTSAPAVGVATCVAGSVQGGWSATSANDPRHATIWTGTTSQTDLHPLLGYDFSQVYATDGANHGGVASPDGATSNAAYWAAGTFVNFHPAGYQSSEIRGVAANKQVGWGMDGTNVIRALVWAGTAASVVDLNAFLPGGYSGAQALGIDQAGNIVGVAYDSGGQPEACMWQVPQAHHIFIGFLSPVNDPATPESVFKRGRTIPFKFRLRTPAGVNVPDMPATLGLELIGTTTTPVNEDDYDSPGDSGISFRYNSCDELYKFNLSTRNLLAGRRYRATARLANGQTHSVTFSLR